MAYALIYGTPVVGLGTWELQYGGLPAAREIIRAAGPVEAAEKALAAAVARRGPLPTQPSPSPSREMEHAEALALSQEGEGII